MRKTVAIDFDGVIHTYAGWLGDIPTGAPVVGVREALEELNEIYDLVVFSTRRSHFIEQYLREYKLDKYIKEVANTKPMCVVLIDDRAVTFKGDWKSTVKEVLNFSAFWENTPQGVL